MTDSHRVYRLTQEAYDQLRLAADEDPNSYLDPAIDFHRFLEERGVVDPFEETSITTDRPISLTPAVEGEIPNRADRQALDFYKSFAGMSPSRATDERLWAWMTHFRLHAYGLKRWRRPSNVNMKTMSGLTGSVRDQLTLSGDTTRHPGPGGWLTPPSRLLVVPPVHSPPKKR